MCMKNKAMIIFSLTALLMFSQYALPNSFADSNNATTYSVSDLNATSSASFIPPVIVQSSSDTSPDSSTVQTVVTQSVPAQPDTVQPIANQSIPVQSIPVQSISTQPSTVQPAVNQSVSVQPVNTPGLRGTIPSHSSQIPSGKTFNSITSSKSYTNGYVPSANPSDQKIISSHGIQDWLSTYHAATYQSRVSNYMPQYQQYVSSPTPQSTNTIVSPNSATSYYGDPVTFTATITESSASANAISGMVSWSDNGAGGTFTSTYCTLYSASCSVSYTPSTNAPSSVIITANYGGDSSYQSSSGSTYLTVNLLHNTTTSIAASSASTYSSQAVTYTATVTDPLGSLNAITGTVSWSDNGAGGTFSSCTIYSASCSVTYTPATNAPSSVTITATYSGDSTHRSSSGSTYLTVNAVHSTITTITPNPAPVYSNQPVTLAATVTDPLGSSSSITGTVSWSDNGAGGTFSQIYCYIPSDSCTTTYTPNASYSGTITVTANYGGDNLHAASSGTSTLTAVSSVTQASYTTSSSNIQTDKTSYAPGNTVTITASPAGAQAGQNVAILVTDPSSNIVASRTVQTDAQGNSELQVGLLPNAQAGTYQVTATALVNGNLLSYRAEFTVSSQISQSSGLSIVSAQPTDQMGDKTVTSFVRGTTSYAKVVLSSNSTQTVLVTVNLVGSDGTSLGVGSVKTTLGAGSSEMEVSFYIPNNASVGTGNIYVDTYSDWPSNGGVPLTAETSSNVSVG